MTMAARLRLFNQLFMAEKSLAGGSGHWSAESANRFEQCSLPKLTLMEVRFSKVAANYFSCTRLIF